MGMGGHIMGPEWRDYRRELLVTPTIEELFCNYLSQKVIDLIHFFAQDLVITKTIETKYKNYILERKLLEDIRDQKISVVTFNYMGSEYTGRVSPTMILKAIKILEENIPFFDLKFWVRTQLTNHSNAYTSSLIPSKDGIIAWTSKVGFLTPKEIQTCRAVSHSLSNAYTFTKQLGEVVQVGSWQINIDRIKRNSHLKHILLGSAVPILGECDTSKEAFLTLPINTSLTKEENYAHRSKVLFRLLCSTKPTKLLFFGGGKPLVTDVRERLYQLPSTFVPTLEAFNPYHTSPDAASMPSEDRLNMAHVSMTTSTMRK